MKNATTERAKALRGLRRRLAAGADRHAHREPPGRAVEPPARDLAGAAGELGAVPRALRRADREVRRRRAAQAGAGGAAAPVRACAGPRPRWRPSCRRAPRSCAAVRLSAGGAGAVRAAARVDRWTSWRSASSDPDRDASDMRFVLLAALTRLRQLCCHPRLVYPRTPRRLGEGGVPARAAGRAARGRAQGAGVQPVPQLPRAAGAAPAAARLPRAGARRHHAGRGARAAHRRLPSGARPTCS